MSHTNQKALVPRETLEQQVHRIARTRDEVSALMRERDACVARVMGLTQTIDELRDDNARAWARVRELESRMQACREVLR